MYIASPLSPLARLACFRHPQDMLIRHRREGGLRVGPFANLADRVARKQKPQWRILRLVGSPERYPLEEPLAWLF